MMNKLIERFIDATNKSDVKATLALFAPDAVIDDVSVGDKFTDTDGVRRYLDQFFVGYHTSTKLLSIEMKGNHRAIARVDFTGDFGHEIGLLDVSINQNGLIQEIAADLE